MGFSKFVISAKSVCFVFYDHMRKVLVKDTSLNKHPVLWVLTCHYALCRWLAVWPPLLQEIRLSHGYRVVLKMLYNVFIHCILVHQYWLTGINITKSTESNTVTNEVLFIYVFYIYVFFFIFMLWLFLNRQSLAVLLTIVKAWMKVWIKPSFTMIHVIQAESTVKIAHYITLTYWPYRSVHWPFIYMCSCSQINSCQINQAANYVAILGQLQKWLMMHRNR